MACNLPVVPLCLRRGEDVDLPLRFESSVWRYIIIDSVNQGAPVVITTDGAHGLADRWRGVIINGTGGNIPIAAERPLNKLRDSDYIAFDVTDTDELEINGVVSIGWSAYAGGSVIAVPVPVDLGEFVEARMQINTPSGEMVRYMTSADDLVFDIPNNAIRLKFSVPIDMPLGIHNHDIELVRADGTVKPVASFESPVVVLPEQTTNHP